MIKTQDIKVTDWSWEQELSAMANGRAPLAVHPNTHTVMGSLKLNAVTGLDEGLNPKEIQKGLEYCRDQVRHKLIHMLYGDFKTQIMELRRALGMSNIQYADWMQINKILETMNAMASGVEFQRAPIPTDAESVLSEKC